MFDPPVLSLLAGQGSTYYKFVLSSTISVELFGFTDGFVSGLCLPMGSKKHVTGANRLHIGEQPLFLHCAGLTPSFGLTWRAQWLNRPSGCSFIKTRKLTIYMFNISAALFESLHG